MGENMKNSVNGSALKPSGILDGDTLESKKYRRVYDWIITDVVDRHSILKDKALILMVTASIAWFFAFFYFVLFIFT